MFAMKFKEYLLNWYNELSQPIHLEQNPETAALSQNNERNEIFDVLKGIAIILVIIGHCKEGFALWPFIYSFHMPLFFFITGYFLKPRPFRKELALSFQRLIIPYSFTAVIICIVVFFKGLSSDSWIDEKFVQDTIIKFLLGYRGGVTPSWLATHVGILWFILAMFWARGIVNILIQRITSIKILCFLFILLGILGMILEKKLFVPYCIPQGLFASGYIYTGYLIRKFNLLDVVNIKLFFPPLLIFWMYSWSQGTLGMVYCDAPVGYVFCLLGATGALYALYTIVNQLFCSNAILWRTFRFWGRYSLIVYCIHSIEMDVCNWGTFAVLYGIPLKHFGAFEMSIRLSIAFIFTLIILKIKPLRERIFQIKGI